MTPERIRELKVRFSLDMIERAERARQEGQIKGYTIYALESDPTIVDHILMHK